MRLLKILRVSCMNPVTHSQSVVRSSLISFSHLCLHLPNIQSLCRLGFQTKISLSAMCTTCTSYAIFHGSTVASEVAKTTGTVYLTRIANCEAPHYTVFCSILFLNTVCVMPLITGMRALCFLKFIYVQ